MNRDVNSIGEWVRLLGPEITCARLPVPSSGNLGLRHIWGQKAPVKVENCVRPNSEGRSSISIASALDGISVVSPGEAAAWLGAQPETLAAFISACPDPLQSLRAAAGGRPWAADSVRAEFDDPYSLASLLAERDPELVANFVEHAVDIVKKRHFASLPLFSIYFEGYCASKSDRGISIVAMVDRASEVDAAAIEALNELQSNADRPRDELRHNFADILEGGGPLSELDLTFRYRKLSAGARRQVDEAASLHRIRLWPGYLLAGAEAHRAARVALDGQISPEIRHDLEDFKDAIVRVIGEEDEIRVCSTAWKAARWETRQIIESQCSQLPVRHDEVGGIVDGALIEAVQLAVHRSKGAPTKVKRGRVVDLLRQDYLWITGRKRLDWSRNNRCAAVARSGPYRGSIAPTVGPFSDFLNDVDEAYGNKLFLCQELRHLRS